MYFAMTMFELFSAKTGAKSPLDASKGEEESRQVSGFLTIQSFTNFSAMTGGIIAAWSALKLIDKNIFSSLIVPFVFAFLFGIISIVISIDGLKKEGKPDFASIAAAIFIGIINALVLASAVIGASGMISSQ